MEQWTQIVECLLCREKEIFKYFRFGLSPSKKFVFIHFNESPLKLMKIAFYFMLKALFVFGIFPLLSWRFGSVEKRLNKKVIVIFNLFDITDWKRNNSNTRVAQNVGGSFLALVNSCKSLTNATKNSTLDVEMVLDIPLCFFRTSGLFHNTF